MTDSFTEFYRAAYGGLVAQLYAYCGDRVEAQDAAQEAFARAWSHWRRSTSPSDPRRRPCCPGSRCAATICSIRCRCRSGSPRAACAEGEPLRAVARPTGMISRPLAVLAVFVAVAGLTACAQVATPGADPGTWPQGRTFLSTFVSEDGADKALVEGTRIELRFDDDQRLSANAGCNIMAGTGRIDEDHLVVGSLSMTEMGCSGGRMEQDAWVADFLTSGPRLAIAGDELTLTGDHVTIVLTDRRVVDPDRPLAGTIWVVDTLFAGETASSVPPSVPAVLAIGASGNFDATTGCEEGALHGHAAIAGGIVTFTVTEQVPCTEDGNALDAAVRSVLAGSRTYEITAARLRIMAADGTGLGLIEQES